MNFLGHFYLSSFDPELLVGNFIADDIKGKKYLDFPEKISKGIMMHREIDFYTDHHPIVKQGRERLFGKYRHYSGVIIDMYYDHFLASLWDNYSEESLSSYANSIYKTLEKYTDQLPERSQFLFPHMKSGNWLLRYASIEGIGQSLNGMSRRLNNNSKLNLAVYELNEFYDEFKAEFQEFIVAIKKHFDGNY
jgi:acyl carrier protein phosphodiesterase